MKINKKIIIFTNDYPTGDSEETFIKFELSNLSKHFKEIEIIPQNNLGKVKKFNKNISINYGLSEQFTKKNIILFILFHTLFSLKFYIEILANLFRKNFFSKLKMIIIEITKSEIALNWILKNKKHKEENIIFYSFWSDYLLITFEKLKKNSNIKTISRVLGSDLNGYIENDDYVPYIKNKFYSLDKLIVLANFQKKKLLKARLIDEKKIIISPLGIYKYQNKIKKLNTNEIRFLSCNNFIKIKNTIKMIKFVTTFSKHTKKRIRFYIIGKGEEYNRIKSELELSKKLFEYKLIKKVKNLPKFMIINKINFFMNFSSQEGMSFSVMEALSCGIPVICSNIDANKNLVNKKRGYLINLSNFDKSILIQSRIIENEFKNSNIYMSKRKNAMNFVNKNLINKKCYKHFFMNMKNI